MAQKTTKTGSKTTKSKKSSKASEARKAAYEKRVRTETHRLAAIGKKISKAMHNANTALADALNAMSAVAEFQYELEDNPIENEFEKLGRNTPKRLLKAEEALSDLISRYSDYGYAPGDEDYYDRLNTLHTDTMDVDGLVDSVLTKLAAQPKGVK